MALREGVSRPCWGSVLLPASVFFIIILILIIVFVLCSGLIPVFITSGLLSATRGRGRGAGGGGRGCGLGFTCQHGKILDLFSKMLLQRVLNSDQQVAASTSEALNTNESQQSVICCLKLV